MTEREVKARVRELCDRHGAYWVMTVPTGYGRRGVPDFLICHRGRFIAVETKRGAVATPSGHQRGQLDAAAAAGGVAMVINATNLGELERVLAGDA